jgi:hypothetical protein
MASKFQPDPSFEKAWSRSEHPKKIAREAATDIAKQAQRNTQSKRIREGIVVEVGEVEGSTVARVIAKHFISGFFEFGTVKMRAQPYLRPAAVALGYILKAGKRA